MSARSFRQPKALPAAFYRRNTVEVARELLGKVLQVRTPEGVCAGRIVETEAYRAGDPASHSARGETRRSAIMFGEAGVAYVYFIYGMYEMLNFVTEPKGDPGAVLIRAVEPLEGIDLMMKRRCKKKGDSARLANGPGKLARAMGITLSHNGAPLQGPELFVRDDGYSAKGIATTPRVGIRLGTDLLWRFFIPDHPCVSKAPQNQFAR